MSVKSMHTALMEMANNQLDEERATELDERLNAPIVHDGAKRAKDDLKSAASNLNSAAKNAKTGKKGLQKAKKEVGTAQSTLKGTKLESVERATWVPDTIADEQVEAFMEAAITSMLEGADTFVFEGKHYKAKSKAEAKKLDPVGKADADIDNDGDVDSSDDYLKNRRKAIKKSMAEEMDPTDHVKYNDEMKMYCVYDKDSKVVAKFEDEKEANAYAIKNHDALMGKDKMDEAAAPGSTAQHGPNDATSDTYQKQMNTGSADVPMGDKQAFVDQHKMEVALDAEQEYMKNKAEAENVLKQTPPRMGDQRNGDTSFVNPIKAEVIDGITKALQQMKTNN
jgi:hypothetical protein